MIKLQNNTHDLLFTEQSFDKINIPMYVIELYTKMYKVLPHYLNNRAL